MYGRNYKKTQEGFMDHCFDGYVVGGFAYFFNSYKFLISKILMSLKKMNNVQ